MIYFNLLPVKDDSPEPVASIALLVDTDGMLDVSNEPIKRGDSRVEIHGRQYDVNEYDRCVQGAVSRLLVLDPAHLNDNSYTNYLIVEHAGGEQFDAISAVDDILDTNVNTYKFTNGAKTMAREKVVGTTFRFKEHGFKEFTEFAGSVENENGTPVLTGQAILLPEIDNQYDPDAIKVVAKMADGSAFHIGYLPRGSAMQKQIQTPTPATLIITAYSTNGDYNDAYAVEL